MALPDELTVTTLTNTPGHDRMCDAVLNDRGYITLGSFLYDVVSWREIRPHEYRWTLHRVRAPRC